MVVATGESGREVARLYFEVYTWKYSYIVYGTHLELITCATSESGREAERLYRYIVYGTHLELRTCARKGCERKGRYGANVSCPRETKSSDGALGGYFYRNNRLNHVHVFLRYPRYVAGLAGLQIQVPPTNNLLTICTCKNDQRAQQDNVANGCCN